MFLYRKEEIEQLAQKYNFRKETLEKELRLIEILKFINNNGLTKNKLVLKGGTAINFCVFDLPRLSVDIDSNDNITYNEVKKTEYFKLLLANISKFAPINNIMNILFDIIRYILGGILKCFEFSKELVNFIKRFI